MILRGGGGVKRDPLNTAHGFNNLVEHPDLQVLIIKHCENYGK